MVDVARQARAAAEAAAPERAAHELVHRVLGPGGVAGTPLVTHEEITVTATELARHLLRVDDCWVQPAGEYAESLGRSAAENGGAWLGNPSLSSGIVWGATRIRGAIGAAPFLVGGERRLLMVHAVTPRAWTRGDHALLREVALGLETALEATLGHQRTPAQEARARYDELRSELLTVLNHELRTPLTALNAGMEMLEDLHDDLPPPAARLLDRMAQNVARLLELSVNVTTLGDVATPQSRVDAARFDPADAVAVARLCASGLPPGLEVDVRADEGDGRLLVAAPAEEVRELLDRVLSNAVKFSPPGGRIAVTVERRSSRITVTVSDEGPGVPEDEQHAVGQPFFRASNARELEIQGSGLGLAAATAIARRRSGSVDLRSGPDGGAVVTLRLPAAEHAPPATDGEGRDLDANLTLPS